PQCAGPLVVQGSSEPREHRVQPGGCPRVPTWREHQITGAHAVALPASDRLAERGNGKQVEDLGGGLHGVTVPHPARLVLGTASDIEDLAGDVAGSLAGKEGHRV